MHIPVLKDEIVKHLSPNEGETILDCTAGGGGHILALAEKISGSGVFIFMDRDEDALERTLKRLENVPGKKIPILGNFSEMDSLLLKHNIKTVDKILMDLGWSNFQIVESSRGFSFQKDEPLKMTYEKNPQKDSLTANEIINNWSEENLKLIFRVYGEEKRAGKISRVIVERRKIKKFETSLELADFLEKAIGRRGKIHPATKIFQALRITVNNELESLKNGLRKGFEILKPKGKMAVISFHSLEDREVKNFFKEKKLNNQALIISKKPIIPSRKEILENKKSRSAKLRILEKI